MVRRTASLLLVLLLGACAGQHRSVSSVDAAAAATEPVSVWRTAIAPADLIRLEALSTAITGLGAKLPPARRKLADPAAALDHPELSPGSYRCRAAAARAADFCYVSATPEGLALVKQTGARPIAGYLHLDDQRYVFLGAAQRRAGDNTLGYGTDPARSVVGTAERVGAFRWRLILTGAGTATPQLYELTPVPADQQPDR